MVVLALLLKLKPVWFFSKNIFRVALISNSDAVPYEIPKHLRMFSCLKLIAVFASRKKSSIAPEFKVETLGAFIAISCTDSSSP